MQVQQLKSAGFKLLLTVFGLITFFSFTTPNGGDHFEIYLNKKLVFEQFVSAGTSSVKTFPLDRNSSNAEIQVMYNHCGQAGKSRTIKITDAGNHLLKEWSFGNGKEPRSLMTCQVKEILDNAKNSPLTKLNIYYSSEQLPKGKLLAAIVLVDKQTAP